MTAPSGSCTNAPSGRTGSSAASAGEVSSHACVAAHHERRPAHALAGEGTRPQHELDGRPVGADPLRLDVFGDHRAVQARAELDAGRNALGEIERPVQRRRVVLGPHPRGLAVARRAAGGVEPHRIGSGEVGLFGQLLPHGDRVAERRQVVGGDRRRHLVGVDRLNPDAESGEPEGVAADSAAEVGDRSDPGVAQSPGVPRGDRQTGRLLEARAGEQHPLGEVAELRACLHAQPRLADDRRDELGGVARLAQPGDGAGDVVGGVDGVELVEQPQPLGREQRGQLGHIHGASLGRRPRDADRAVPVPAASPIDPPITPLRPLVAPPQPRGHPRCRRARGSRLIPTRR